MELKGLYKKPRKAKRVFKREPGMDGFFIELENGGTLKVAMTQWCTKANTHDSEDGIIFKSKQGEIFISNNQIKLIEPSF